MKKIKVSTVITVILGAFVVVMLLNPDMKAWVNRGLMKVGLFKPDLGRTAPQPPESSPVSTSTPAKPPMFVDDGEGNRIDVGNQAGKVVFINFWATWCPPCIAELPSIDKLYQQFKDNEAVVFAIVDVDSQYEKSKQFMESKKLGLPVHVVSGEIPTGWLGNAIPTTLILDKKGQIAARHEGMADYSRPEVTAFINQLIAAE